MSVLEVGDHFQRVAPTLVVALVVVICFVVAGAARFWFPPRSRSFQARYQPIPFENYRRPDLTDVGQQLHAVMAAPFEKRRVLSSSEYRAFKVIEDDMAAAGRGYRVFAQTSLGQILKSPNSNAFRSINSKRVDILIVDRGGWPVAAVEYQGSGHYQGTAAGRDAVKKEALRKAGVRYIEVSESDSPEQILSRVREHLGWAATAPTNYGNSPRSPVHPIADRGTAEARPQDRIG
jgi:Protein of unknown function (DUF2726)